MKGFRTVQNKNLLHSYNNSAGDFKLLVDDENMEIFESKVKKGKSIICQPYESIDAINVILILKGKLFHTNDQSFLETGAIITFKDLEITHHLYVVEDTILLSIRNSKHFSVQVLVTNDIYEMIHKIQVIDKYTEEHCNYTGNLGVQISTFMKLDENVIQNIMYAGKIHDIGKIYLDKNILNKPGKLTIDEYEEVKKHSQYGHDIIKSKGVYNEVAKIVLEHHERLDGSGYPNGLKGEQISMEAKVLAVADSFHAMISKRTYKKAMSINDAIKELKRYSGIWYEKEVVDAICTIVEYNILQ